MRQLRWQRFLIVIGFWGIFGTFSAFLTYYRYSGGPKPYSLGRSFFIELSYAALGALATPLIFWLASQFRIERKAWLRNFGIHITASIAVGAVEAVAWSIIVYTPDAYLSHGLTTQRVLRSISAAIDTGAILYWLLLLMDYAIDYYQKYQNGLVAAAQLQTQLVQAQLQSLKMQLHPHFLFNTLHTISALVQEDPEACERTIARLSELLRISLETSAFQEVRLEEELTFLNLYLDIERTRFEERLAVEFHIEDETRSAMVPNMILQPIVENAIRHGLANRTSEGRLSISASKENGNLLLRVKDNGCGLPKDPIRRRQGLGLAATRGRLERLYGSAQSLVLRNLQSGGVEARITMPFAGQGDKTARSHGKDHSISSG